MSLIRIQGEDEKKKGIHYEYDPSAEPLGEGGMGVVFKGQLIDENTGVTRPVAVKRMRPGLPEHVLERARREANIRIRHDNVVKMLGFIEMKNDNLLDEERRQCYVVSELLMGVTLENLLQGQLSDQDGNTVHYAEKLYEEYKHDPCRFAVRVVSYVLSGLLALHDAKYIHRDISSSNIMITRNGYIKIIDFGIAKRMNTLTTGDNHLTQTGVFTGRAEYAAPELVLGDINRQNQTTDIYAVGVLLFQCIVGHPPFEGDRYKILNSQLHDRIPLRQIPDKGLRGIIRQSTEKQQGQRYHSAAEFRAALDGLSRSSGGFPLARVAGIAAAAALVLMLVVMAAHRLGGIGGDGIGGADSTATDSRRRPHRPTYDHAVATLHSDTPRDGLSELHRLSEEGHAEASFLLSQLWFESLKEGDYRPDSITSLRKAIGIGTDHKRAHRLLKKAVEQDSTFYQALYELGCDYLGGINRTYAVERNLNKAAQCLQEAMKYARQANDQHYMKLIENQQSKLNR